MIAIIFCPYIETLITFGLKLQTTLLNSIILNVQIRIYIRRIFALVFLKSSKLSKNILNGLTNWGRKKKEKQNTQTAISNTLSSISMYKLHFRPRYKLRKKYIWRVLFYRFWKTQQWKKEWLGAEWWQFISWTNADINLLLKLRLPASMG